MILLDYGHRSGIFDLPEIAKLVVVASYIASRNTSSTSVERICDTTNNRAEIPSSEDGDCDERKEDGLSIQNCASKPRKRRRKSLVKKHEGKSRDSSKFRLMRIPAAFYKIK